MNNGIELANSIVVPRCLAARTAATLLALAAVMISTSASNAAEMDGQDTHVIHVVSGNENELPIAWDQLDFFYKKSLGYAKQMANRPQRPRHTPLSLEESSEGLMAVPAHAMLASIMQNCANPLISVVDDDEGFRKATANLLNASGFSVEKFSSAEEFLDSPHMNETGCLILDLQMHGMSGLELQSHLGMENRRIPIIFITARGNAAAREEAMRAGAIDFLPKPFNEEVLLRAIHKALT
jgi:CheY-like chemotaxis protein